MKKLIAALCLILCTGTVALASNDDANPCGNHGNNCCTEDGGQTYVPTEQTCTQVVEANPKAYCSSFAASVAEAQAKAICGNATASCAGGLAFTLAVTKQACVNSSIQANVTDVTCEAATLACGDASASCALSCPEPTPCPDVNVNTRVLRCKRVITKKSGKVIRKGCLVITEAQ